MPATLHTRRGSISAAPGLRRTIAVRIDATTWPAGSVPPASFSGTGSYSLDIYELLLLIGELTTPEFGRGVTLSEHYAWVRYLHALTPGPRLQISNPFLELDAHQKTILSDDFGMGIGIYWARDKLGLRDAIDGRYFIMHLMARNRATLTQRANKRGPTKSPDFVAPDGNGVWHVVECKGTQSGRDYRHRQLTNGKTQKDIIRFPPATTGQRLVCASTLEPEGSRSRSELLVIDPYRGKRFAVSDNELVAAQDASIRSTVAKGLRRAGFPVAANAIAHPFGEPEQVSRGRLRLGSVPSADGRQAALAEIAAGLTRDAFRLRGTDFVGNANVFPVLPFPAVKRKVEGPVRLRYGVSRKLLEALQADGLSNGAWAAVPGFPDEIFATETLEADELGRTEVKGGLFSSELSVGRRDGGVPVKVKVPAPSSGPKQKLRVKG